MVEVQIVSFLSLKNTMATMSQTRHMGDVEAWASAVLVVEVAVDAATVEAEAIEAVRCVSGQEDVYDSSLSFVLFSSRVTTFLLRSLPEQGLWTVFSWYFHGVFKGEGDLYSSFHENAHVVWDHSKEPAIEAVDT